MTDLVLVKVDANAGRSGVWGGRAFRLGVHVQENLSQEDHDKAAVHFERFYGSKPVRAARGEHPALFEEGGPYHGDHPVLGARRLRREGVEPAEGAADVGAGDAAPAPGPERGPAAAGRGHERPNEDGRRDPGQDRRGEQELLTLPQDTEEDGSIEAEPAADEEEPDIEEVPVAQEVPEGAAELMDLGEAVGYLDPGDDAHWTAQGLPALTALEGILGRKVVRREVDGVALGYTRTKAQQVKG